MKMPASHGPIPSARQLAWHRRPLYGFVHFTVNTFTDREWGCGDEAEGVFAPSELDCRQWVAAARAGGLAGLILTAKHHDGFCLWPTETTAHNIARSAFRDGKGDVVRELSEACREAGLRFGIYCSPWDRNHAEYGRPGYVEVYRGQWRELLANYGPLFELWFDGANGGDGFYGGARERRNIDAATYYRFGDIWEMCRHYQPDAAIFSDAGPDLRWCGNESGLTGCAGWAKVRPEGFVPGKVDSRQRLIEGDPDGTVWRPVEVDVSIRPGWFWHRTETPRSGENLFQLWLASVGRGAGMNLNLTPDRRGLIPTEDIVELRRFRALVEGFCGLDVARGCQVEAGSTASGDARHLTDGDEDTWWEAVGATDQVVVTFGQAQRVHAVRIDEAISFGQRVESFAIDLGLWGSWYEVARGATIGARRIIPINPIPGTAIRLRILASQAAPVLSQIQVFAG
jgi:alpha-L-fucosidase